MKYIILLSFLISCQSRFQNKPIINLQPGKVNKIVLINIGNEDREYIGKLITKVNEFNPKIIGVDAFFTKRKNDKKDSILQSAIKNASVILAANEFMKKNPKISHPYFSNYSVANSTVGVLFYHESAVMFRPHRDLVLKKFNHFSVSLSLQYDSLTTTKYLSGISIKKDQPIVFTKLAKDFTIYPTGKLDFEKSDIQDKIVILAYLGPTKKDTSELLISGKTEQMYGAVVLANIVLQILNSGSEI